MRQDIQEKILKVFYENPSKSFTVRKLMKITKIPRATAHKYLTYLKKQDLISDNNKAKKTLLFKTKKINYFVEQIVACGLVDYFVEQFKPSCIILFGSIRKGDSVGESDIDLMVESSIKKKIDLGKFEKKLGHNIQLFIEKDIKKLQPHLLNNVVNGIKLYGSFKIK